MMIVLTLCHCRPTKTPTWLCAYIIGVEVDFHFVRFGCYDRRLEVQAIRWISIRVSAAFAQQGRPVPIGDTDNIFVAFLGLSRSIDGKGGELKPQDLSRLHSDLVCLPKIVRVVARIVW